MIDPRLTGMLIIRELRESRRQSMWFGAAAIFVLFFIFMGRLFMGGSYDNAQGFIAIVFALMGTYLASEAFSELKRAKNARQYLMLPAGSAEKVIAKVVFYTIGWFVLFALCWFAAGAIATLVFALLKGSAAGDTVFIQFFSIFKTLFYSWYWVLLLQSAAIFASCYFRRLALLKSIISLGVLAFAMAIIATGEGFMLYHGYGYSDISIEITPQAKMFFDNGVLSMQLYSGAVSFVVNVVKYAALPALWALTWLRLRETEAR